MLINRTVNSWTDTLDQTAFWEGLHQRLAPDNPFVSPLWSKMWFDTHADSKKRQVILFSAAGAKEGGILLLSKGKTRRFKIPVVSIESIGSGVSAYDRHLVARQEPLLTKEAITPLLKQIADFKGWAFFRLAPLPATYPLSDVFEYAAGKQGLFCIRRAYSKGYTIQTGMGWEAYVNSRSKGFRKKLNASNRKMKESNLFTITAYKDFESAARLSGILNAISLKSWKAKVGTDVFNPAYNRFWELALPSTLAAGKSTIWVLYCQDKPAAYEWHLHEGRNIIALKSDYDQDFAAFSPGNLLAWHAMQHAFQTGASEIDFLMGGSDYKKRWATDTYQLDELLIFNKSLYSRIWRKILLKQDRILSCFN
jgi:CelD/BcsL family acetyltransferase involved in cellulose biosynthesis